MGIEKIKKIECVSCEAVFTVTYEDLSDYYKPSFCAFCGEEIEHEEELDFVDAIEEED